MKCIKCGFDNPDPQREMSSKGGKASRRKITPEQQEELTLAQQQRQHVKDLELLAEVLEWHKRLHGPSLRVISAYLGVHHSRIQRVARIHLANTGERIGHQPRRTK